MTHQHGTGDGLPEAARDATPGTERLVAYTDAVAAIALTLLALPLVDVVREAGAAHDPVGELAHNNVSTLGAFVLSFLLISNYWWAHHQLLHRIARTSGRLVAWNTLWVLAVVVLPVATELITAYGPQVATVAVYGAVLLGASGSLLGLAAEAQRHPELRRPGTSVREPLVGSVVACALLLVAALLGLVAPHPLGFSGYALLLLSGPVEAAVRRRWPAPPAPPAPSAPAAPSAEDPPGP